MINKYLDYIFYNNNFIIKNKNKSSSKLVYKNYNNIIFNFVFL